MWEMASHGNGLQTHSKLEAQYPSLHSVISVLPGDIGRDLRELSSAETRREKESGVAVAVENVVRFVCGGGRYEGNEEKKDKTSGRAEEWVSGQKMFRELVKSGRGFRVEVGLGLKRNREEEEEEEEPSKNNPKKQRVSRDPPQHTLHSISLPSPIHKKANITIHERTVRINTGGAPERARLSPPPRPPPRVRIPDHRETQKKHWSVALLTTDAGPRPKNKALGGAANDKQIVFGVDAVATTPISTTTTTIEKGQETITIDDDFRIYPPSPSNSLSHSLPALPLAANLAAKPGTLWLTPLGILWSDSHPAMFLSLHDLTSHATGPTEGVQTQSATGRVCVVVVTRRVDCRGGGEREGGKGGVGAGVGVGAGEGGEGEGEGGEEGEERRRNSEKLRANSRRWSICPLTITQLMLDSDDDEDDEDGESRPADDPESGSELGEGEGEGEDSGSKEGEREGSESESGSGEESMLDSGDKHKHKHKHEEEEDEQSESQYNSSSHHNNTASSGGRGRSTTEEVALDPTHHPLPPSGCHAADVSCSGGYGHWDG
ncbi:hypothetical protein F5876DRAFT_70537 [Lentinula aff. lateritia]|uniref:Uncharacterized protein n=1 Tax=Lentinula aff. lateritia TaxID=2804960 RepID=A0ACC1TIR7_9AGAR|nr:hypothetical protein F5876DRAFT_70537 [Lentinula aff. lateritia]